MKYILVTLSILGLAASAQAQTSPSRPATAPTTGTMSGPATNEAQAKELVLRDGYTEVGELKKGGDGQWHGTAKRGDKPMQVTVDKEGKVSP